MSKKLALLLAPLLLAGVAAAQTGSVTVSDAWARATPSKAEVGAAYMTLESPSGDRLAPHRPRVLAKPFHLRHLIAEIEALLAQ